MSSAQKHHKTQLLDFFPPPQFLLMSSVGVDLSDEAVRFLQLKPRGSYVELGMFGEQKIPRGLIEEGYIKDKRGLIDVLKNFQQSHGFKFIKASLPEEKAYLFRTSVPMMDEGDIHDALQFKIEENVPVGLRDAVYDYRFLKKPESHDKELHLNVTVMHIKVVSSYLEVFAAAGFTPLKLHVESQAVARSIIGTNEPGTFIIVALRETKTILAIVSDAEVQFTSTIPIGGRSIIEAIKKNFSVNEDEAEKIRSGKELKESTEMFLSLVSAATALRDEIQKLYAYWDSRSGEIGRGQNIQEVRLAGADALLGLDHYLGRSLNVPVSIADPWKNVYTSHDGIPPLTRRESLDFVSAIGLSL